MLEPAVDEKLRASGLLPVSKPWTQFGFTPTSAALECPWGEEESTVTQAYYAWARFEPGQRDVFIDLVRDNEYLLEESERGMWLVAPPEAGGRGDPVALITADWVAFADSRDQIDDIVWTR